MRMILAAMVTTVALGVARPAAANEYPWCADYSIKGGATNCGFSTLEQCRATVSGIGGMCRRNLFYAGAEDAPRPAAKQRARKHHRVL